MGDALPNLILTWASTLDSSNPTAAPFSEDSPNPFHDSEESHGDLYITPELTSAFLEALSACPLTLSFISGFLEGGEFNALVSMKVRNKAKRTDIRAEAQVALTAMGTDIKGGANVTIAKENIDMNTE